ncbi:hypothetical protein ACOMHN_008314 [Nucella lapillus]
MTDFQQLQPELQEYFEDDTIRFTNEVSGGIVNKAALFSSHGTREKYFVKYNPGEKSEQMFEAECRSLQMLETTRCVTVPKSFKVFGCKTMPGAAHVLEFMPGLTPLKDHWTEFGQQIGKLHALNSQLLQRAKVSEGSVHHSDLASSLRGVDKFGSEQDHFIGTFTPGKGWRGSWKELFIGDILQPLVSGVVEKHREVRLQEEWAWLQRHLHKVFDQVPITPAITHGDLCLANFGQTQQGPVLFDPSVQYAHSQFDLLLSHAEDPFDDRFFEAYHSIMPRGPFWDECMLVYEFFYNVVMLYFVDEEKFKTALYPTLDSVKDMLKNRFGAE